MSLEDPPAKHLVRIVDALTGAGFVELVRDEVRELWRANCERYEPEQLHDDAATLGFVASRNVANAVTEVVREENIATSRLDEFGVRVFEVAAFDVRIFKTAGSVGRRPTMSSFDWRGRESRLAAARRNDRYVNPASVPGHEPLFELPELSSEANVDLLNDVFVFWGGDVETRLTAGWAGLPTSRPGSWTAVMPLWWDETLPKDAKATIREPVDPSMGIGGQPVPTPVVRLRQTERHAEAE